MIYNLVQYLRTKFPDETFYINGRYGTSMPDRNVVVRETGGTETPWFRFSEPTVQILVRDKSLPGSRELVFNIFEELTSRFGEVLPAIVIGSATYPAIQIAQISALQKPFCLGADEQGRTEWTVNFKLIFQEGT